MNLRYVLNAMRRRKLRTFIITVALVIGVALVGALLALVDTQRQFSIQSTGSATGGYDLGITRSDLAASTFFSITEIEATVNDSYSKIAQVYARIQATVEGRKMGATDGVAVTFIALDTTADSLITAEKPASTSTGGIGIAGINIGGTGGGRNGGGGPPPGGGGPPSGGGGGAPPSGGGGGQPPSDSASSSSSTSALSNQQTIGAYPPANGEVYLSTAAATALGVQVGDEVRLSYAIPVKRAAGKAAITGASTPRIEARFIVTGVGTLTGVASDVSNPIIMRLDDAQAWLGQEGQANKLLLVWTSSSTSSSDASATVTQARNVGEIVSDNLQTQLGSDYTVSLPKYTSLESSSSSYAFTQTFITLYGLLSMGIIGLMVNALMNTTVAEQKHDLAVLRVLGSPRHRLYEVVILEVFILGVIGIVLGILLGRVINDYLIVPIVLSNLDLPTGVRAAWTLQTVLIPTAITAAVLTLATISPARTAANTKVMVVLNPAAADQPTLEDLGKLRERHANGGLLIAGLVLLAFSGVILIVLPTVMTPGNMSGSVVLNAGSLLLMVIGIALLFYFLTTPLERLLIVLYRVISPRSAFFAGRYALRGKGGNALISLMVVMSAVLPCLLATQLALQDANLETDSNFSNGAPLIATTSSSSNDFPIFSRFTRTVTNLTATDVAAVKDQPGIGTVVGLAQNLSGMTVSDRIKLRTASVSYLGADGDLNKVLYTSLYRFSEGDATALTKIVSDTRDVIISQGLSTALDLHVGDTLLAQDNGTDHQLSMTIIAVASRIPGFSRYFTRNSSDANNSGVLMSLDTYRELNNDPANGAVDKTANVLSRLLATVQPGVNQGMLIRELRSYLGTNNSMSLTATSESVATARAALSQSRVFIVLLTGLSMITAIVGVLAVMYTAVMGRRLEIGMLKAIGAAKGSLRGVFIGESVITTLAAGLAGITAGTILGYAFVLSQRLQSDQPFLLAFDFNTAGLIIAMVCFAAVFSGALATQPIIRQKAIVILRER